MANTYILPSNSKAIAHFRDLGIPMSHGVKTPDFSRVWDSNEFDFPVIWIHIDMSGTQFHKYLIKNNLL